MKEWILYIQDQYNKAFLFIFLMSHKKHKIISYKSNFYSADT